MGPVRFAKAGKRFPRSFIRIGLARLQHDRPVRRFERRTTFLQCARNRFRSREYAKKFALYDIKSSGGQLLKVL
jgi:hypothetical protein